MEFRETAFKLLGYPPGQTIAGMLAHNLQKLLAIEAALQDAYEKGRISERRDIALCTHCQPYKIPATWAYHLCPEHKRPAGGEK